MTSASPNGPAAKSRFPLLSVRQNLLRGEARARRHETLAWVETLFPILRTRAEQQARTLSGGEQQMVALARGLMSRPRLLLVDEPTLGLSPKVGDQVVEHINGELGIAVVIVEQSIELALALANRAYVLGSGRVALSGTPEELRRSPDMSRIFLGR